MVKSCAEGVVQACDMVRRTGDHIVTADLYVAPRETVKNITMLSIDLIQASHPTPSLSPSNLCGSGGNTVKLRCGISSQSTSGGRGGIQTVG